MSLTRGELVVLGVCLAAALLALLACTPRWRAQGRLSYPSAPRAIVVDNYHGTPVADPYRWLEELDSPQTRAWLNAQAQLTQAYLQEIPQRARLRTRITQLYDFPRTGIPFSESGRYFYTSNSGQQEQSVLLSVARLGDPPVLVLDPNALIFATYWQKKFRSLTCATRSAQG